MSTNTSSLHVFQILRLVSESAEPLGATDIAKQTALPSTTVYRALMTLCEARYLSRDDSTATYRSGEMPPILLHALFNQFPVRKLALPALRKLAEDTGETACLSTRLGWYAVRVAAVNGHHDTLHKRRVGLTQLLHKNAPQALMLASLSDDEIRSYRRFVRSHYPTYSHEIESSAFLRELRATRQRGYATSRAVLNNGFTFALPIRTANGTPIAVFEIVGPAVTEPEPEIDNRIQHWFDIRDEVESVLQADPQSYASPFAHVPADSIVLHSTGL